MALPAWASDARHDSDARLGAAAVFGAAFVLASGAVKLLGGVGAAVVLARLLTPEDFGLVGMIAPVLAFAVIFSDGGVSYHTLQRETLDEGELSLTFWIGLLIAVAVAGLFALSAPALAWFYGEPRVAPLALALSASFILTGLRMQHDALCKRCMRQDLFAAAEIAATVVSVVVAVAVALLDGGVWALVALQLARAAAHAAASWLLTRWIPRRPRGLQVMREIIAFGGAMMIARLAMTATKSVDKMLLGWREGAVSLGYYHIAHQLVVLPLVQIQTPVAGVAVPYLSRQRAAPDRFAAALADVSAAQACLIWPAMAAAAAAAGPLIGVALGPQWAPSAPIFALLAASLILETARPAVNWGLLALGRAGDAMRWHLFAAAVIVAGFVVALPWGGVGLALSLVVTQAIVTALAFVYGARRGLPVAPALRALLPPAAAALAAAVVTAAAIALSPTLSGWWHAGVAVGAAVLGSGAAGAAVAGPERRGAALAGLRRRR